MIAKRKVKAVANLYTKLIETIFLARFKSGGETVEFQRTDIEITAKSLGVRLPKNLGDLIYTFRYRVQAAREHSEVGAPAANG